MRCVLSKYVPLGDNLFGIVGLKFVNKSRFEPRLMLSNNLEHVCISLEDFDLIITSRLGKILAWFANEGTFRFPHMENFEFFTADSPKTLILRSRETYQCVKINETQFHSLHNMHPCIVNHFRKILEKNDLINFSFITLIAEAGEIVKDLFKNPTEKQIKMVLRTLEKTDLLTDIIRIYIDACVRGTMKYLESHSVPPEP